MRSLWFRRSLAGHQPTLTRFSLRQRAPTYPPRASPRSAPRWPTSPHCSARPRSSSWTRSGGRHVPGRGNPRAHVRGRAPSHVDLIETAWGYTLVEASAEERSAMVSGNESGLACSTSTRAYLRAQCHQTAAHPPPRCEEAHASSDTSWSKSSIDRALGATYGEGLDTKKNIFV